MTRASAAGTHAMRAQIELRERILSGELPGGMRLFEVALAEQLEISRTPIREAMSHLAEEGLLERVRGGGFRVRSFAFDDVMDAIELRGVMEGTAARLAAERGAEPAALAEMQRLLADLDKCFGAEPGEVDFEAYSEHNSRFHAALAALPGRRMIEREVARATQLPFASPSAFLPDNARLAAFRLSLNVAQEQHHALIEAIEARQGARAEAIAREHARAAQRNLRHIFSDDRALIPRVPGLGLVTQP